MNKFLFFFFVLCVPSGLAIDCNSVLHADYCKQIQSSGLSVDEKAYLLGNIMSDKHTTPDHAMVSAWNTNIPTDIKPEGVVTTDKGVIRNAWVKVLAVAPSVLLNKSLVINSSGSVRTNFKHDVVIPTGVESGDCQTYRTMQEHTDVMNLYGNDKFLGEGHNVAFQGLTGDVVLKAVETISVTTKVDHYTWQSKKSGKKIIKVCKFSSTAYTKDTLVLTDQIKVHVGNQPLDASFSIQKKQWETTQAEFTFSNATNTELSFYDASFTQHRYVFSTLVTLPPLNVLVITAEPLVSQEQKNLVYNDNTVTVQNTKGCKIIQSSFFQDKIIPCNLNYIPKEITVSTDKTVYKSGEKIYLMIAPVGNYVVSYGDTQVNATDSLDLSATYPYNRISVRSADAEVFTYIHVKNEEPLNLLFALSVFGLTNVGII